jgi:2-oxoglutarate dehydrogenase E1 component
MGMVRALQFSGPEMDAARDTSSVVPILIHGDAAFAAEGVVAESLNLARLKGYEVGGTIHLIANNQIGFTTKPGDGRSTRYASDLARGYDIPVLHVNADDPEACLAAIRLAMEYRRTFRDDFVIDLVGYRRFGHNEADEPAYTQPLLYEKISGHPTVRTLWAERLVTDGTLTQVDAAAMAERVSAGLREIRARIQEEVRRTGDLPLPPRPTAEEDEERPVTSAPLDVLAELNARLLDVPPGFTVHPKLLRQLDRRREGFGPTSRLDWAQAEALAFGLLLREGVPIRLTGQDTQRGTFSHRHLVLHDTVTGVETTPIATIADTRIEAYNSPLSEVAALGFEYGYSVAAEEDFVLWEAQFGDFVNVAQVIVDQFIASGRAKWGQLSRLALLLPHGYEGQGPEHSSARLERLLQQCAENNMRVASPSTPAQYFHLLRRQALGKPVRPLIVMTPKSLLRLPQASSLAVALSEGTFRPVMNDPLDRDPGEIRRLLFCTGKIYYELADAVARANHPDLAIARIEELYPFPAEEILELVSHYRALEEVVWVQEEPRNMGALSYIGPLLRGVVPRGIHLKHVARPERASPAEGRNKNHGLAQDRIVQEALEEA